MATSSKGQAKMKELYSQAFKNATKMLKAAGSSLDKSQALAALQCYGQLQKSLGDIRSSDSNGKMKKTPKKIQCSGKRSTVQKQSENEEVNVAIASNHCANKPALQTNDTETQDNFIIAPINPPENEM